MPIDQHLHIDFVVRWNWRVYKRSEVWERNSEATKASRAETTGGTVRILTPIAHQDVQQCFDQGDAEGYKVKDFRCVELMGTTSSGRRSPQPCQQRMRRPNVAEQDIMGLFATSDQAVQEAPGLLGSSMTAGARPGKRNGIGDFQTLGRGRTGDFFAWHYSCPD
jgi:hypothetical protein